MELGDSLLRTMSALAIVLGLMLACAVVVRRILARRSPIGADSPLVQVLGGGYLGGRKSVVVVAVAGEILILGATETALIPLGRVNDPERVRRELGERATVKAEVEGHSPWQGVSSS